jgi:hypothetical protein
MRYKSVKEEHTCGATSSPSLAENSSDSISARDVAKSISDGIELSLAVQLLAGDAAHLGDIVGGDLVAREAAICVL